MNPSRAFGDQRAAKAHLQRGTGGLQGEISDLRSDTDVAFGRGEAQTGYPSLVGIQAASITAAGSADITLVGTGLDGQGIATISHGTGLSQLDFFGLEGFDSNRLGIELINPAAPSSALAILGYAQFGKREVLQISLGTDAGSALNSSADDVRNLIRNDATASARLAVTSGGSGIVNILAATDLVGGLGGGYSVLFGQDAADYILSIAPGAIIAHQPVMTGLSAGATAVVSAVINGVRQQLSIPVT